MTPGHNIVSLLHEMDSVRIRLANGTELTLCSNIGSVHLHFSRINLTAPIQVVDQAANQLNIQYTPVNVPNRAR